MKYLPSILWSLISARGLYTWRQNASRMGENLEALRATGGEQLSELFARADEFMGNLSAFAFLNGLILGVLSFFFTYGASWTQTPVFLRIYSDYTLFVLIGAFAVFMINGEIYAYVLEKVNGKKKEK